MIEKLVYSKEGKDIIEKFNNLTPWDKGDMIKYLSDKYMTFEEIEKYFIEGCGYVKWDNVDLPKEVINAGLETEVLDEMDESDICNYLLNSWYAKDNVKQILTDADDDDIANAISDLSEYRLKKIFEYLFENDKDTCYKILKVILDASSDTEKLSESVSKFKESIDNFVEDFKLFNSIDKNE